MLELLRKHVDEDEQGFTLIELLVVVIIIGILAAIAIPTFLNQRERGWEADAQSTVRNAAIAIESCAVAEGGDYTNCGEVADLEAEGFNWDEETMNFEVDRADTEGYSLTAWHASGGDQFTLDSAEGGTIARDDRPAD